MNRKSLFLVVPLIALMLMSCQLINATFNQQVIVGSGNMTRETRAVGNVERITLENRGDLTIVQDDTESLTVEANDNVLPYIETTMNGPELVLKIRNGYTLSSNTKINYTLHVKNLNRISVAGAGNVTAKTLKVGDLALDVAGAGNLTIDQLQANDLRAESSGSGNFNLQGTVNSQDMTINGAGNYMAGDLKSSSANIAINGAGNVTVWVTGTLDVRINGFGDVSYYGNPSVSQAITGGGSVKSLGEHK